MLPAVLSRLRRAAPPPAVWSSAAAVGSRSLGRRDALSAGGPFLRRSDGLGGSHAPATHPSVLSCGPAFLQVRHGPKDGRPGRLQHFVFGCDRAKARSYYRFHKLIGKWNWRKYIERYIAPRAVENRQRWHPSARANYTQQRHSKSWYWRLPKGLAMATTPDEVLEAWILFRHKHPKRTYHYVKALRRLIDVGGCEPTDWRLKHLTSRFRSHHRKVLNLPRLAHCYAQLRLIGELEHMSRFIYKMLPRYPPGQLVLAAHAFGVARVQDKHLFIEVARHVDTRLSEVTPSDLVRLVQAYAATEVCHYDLMARASEQVQLRVQQASQGKSPPRACLSFEQLAEVAEAFARLKYQDYSFLEMCTLQAEHLLSHGLPGPTPPSLALLCSAFARLKVHDVRLFEVVLLHASEHWYDYPASSLAAIGAAIAPVLPASLTEVRRAYATMLGAINADRSTLTLAGVASAAKFMAEVDHKSEFLPGLHGDLMRRIMELRDETQECYDIARVVEIFARRCPENRALFSCLCRHLHRHLAIFEPVDFVRFSRGLVATTYRDDRIVHSLGKWARKRVSEFSPHDWENLLKSLEALRDDGGQLAKQLREHRAADIEAAALQPRLPLPAFLGMAAGSAGGARASAAAAA